MDKKIILSFSWIFLVVNFIFCDVFTLMYSADLQDILNGRVGTMELTQEFLFGFAILMEIPMLMIILSRFAKYKWNRIFNIAMPLLLFIIQAGSLLVDENSLHYFFFSIIEISTCFFILWTAIKWKNAKSYQ